MLETRNVSNSGNSYSEARVEELADMNTPTEAPPKKTKITKDFEEYFYCKVSTLSMFPKDAAYAVEIVENSKINSFHS